MQKELSITERILVHCDLDAFYASVETIFRELDTNIPLIIGSDPKNGSGRGIVSTCNYAARKYGVRSAMPITEAWRRCPAEPFGNAIYVRGNYRLYGRASRIVMGILESQSDIFEQASIDEAYLDITQSCKGNWDTALLICENLKLEIYQKTGLTASFGIASTRILAKMCSEENKPNGIFRLMPDETMTFFEGKNVRDVPGIGKKSSTVLAEWGLSTMDELYEAGELSLERMMGDRFAKWIIRVIEGKTSSEISPLRSRKSISKEHTFSTDQKDTQLVLKKLLNLCEQVVEKAKSMKICGKGLEIKIRYKGFETHTYSRTLPVAMDDTELFLRLSSELFAQSIRSEKPVRLIGFKMGSLEIPDSRQITLDKLNELIQENAFSSESE